MDHEQAPRMGTIALHQHTGEHTGEHTDHHMSHQPTARTSPEHQGHGGDHTGHVELFARLFWWSLVLAIPTIVFSDMVQHWLGYELRFAGAALVAPVLGTAIYLIGGRPFLSGGLAELRARRPGMMLLIAVAISVAFGASVASELGIGDLDFWWELAALIVVMLLGHWLEMRAIGQASGALAALAALLPDLAERFDGSALREVPVSELRIGDLLLVRPGGRVPADGTITDGTANLDEAMITGESRPVRRTVGDRVVAGTVAIDSALRVRVEAVGDDTALAGIQRLVQEAQLSRSKVQALADRAAAALFYLATATALIALVVWSALGDPAAGVEAAITVLVVACPHALGLAIPLVIAISTSSAARAGILVKDRLALERMRTVDTVLFDKTGTLTKGDHAVVGVWTPPTVEVDAVLRLAAAVEASSEHPIARAIVAAAGGTIDQPVTNFSAVPGLGVAATVGAGRVEVGGPGLLRHLGLGEPAELRTTSNGWRDRGHAVLYVVVDGRVEGSIAVADEVRPESRVAIESLRARGIDVVLITGDAQQVADAVAADLGITEVLAEVRPSDKDEAVAMLQARGRRVAMVGDGVNDAPALARSDVGIAIGAGTDVAIESAGVILASDDPRAVVGVIDLSRASYRKMVQNLIWATAYNVGSLPVAAGALSWMGITIAPALAAAAMSASTIVVATNAQLLRRLDLRAGIPGARARTY